MQKNANNVVIAVLLIIFGIPLVSIGLGVFMIIAGFVMIILIYSPKSSEIIEDKNDNQTSQPYARKYSYDIIKTNRGYSIELNMVKGDSDTMFVYNVILVQTFSFNGIVKHLPVLTTNRKYTSDGDFAFSYQKVGTRSQLNGLILNVDTSELIKPTDIGPMSTYGLNSGYFCLILLNEKNNSPSKLIEKFEKLDLSIYQTIKDHIHSDYYGMERFIELAVGLAKVDGDYADKEKTEIMTFINKNAAYGDKTKLIDYFKSLNNKNIRNSESIISDIKHSMSSIKLITKGMELLVNVSVSDGKLELKEKKYLEKYADAFHIDQTTFNQLIRKYISNNDNFKLSLEFFGVTENMTTLEKKQKLNQAYIEWNKKIVSSNAQTRDRAKEVIEFISMERLKLAT
jgi:tellurite resistance protein